MKSKRKEFSVKNMSLVFSFAVLSCIGLSSYAQALEVKYAVANAKGLPNLAVGDIDRGIVVKARAVLSLRPMGGPISGTEGPVTVTLTAATTGTFDPSGFNPSPAMSNAPIDFGTLTFSSLFDNDLNTCGGGSGKCVTAMFRMYTINEPTSGFFNPNYSAPITSGLVGTTLLPVGLNVGSAAVLQTFSIPTAQQVVSLSDFSPAPIYDVQADFTAAAAGDYTTTIVLEYATQ